MNFIPDEGKKVIEKLLTEYLVKRNVEQILDCVTDNVVWVGVMQHETVVGKDNLKKLLQIEIDELPNAYTYKLGN
ncbi:MAG: hypothetical protein RR052_05225, partial [Oscillospiraceae bacterium]